MGTYPGVYKERLRSDNVPTAGTAAGAMAIMGYSPEGEIDKANLYVSMTDWSERCGGFKQGWLVPVVISAFFANGGKRLYFVRVVASDAVKAGLTFTNNVNTETPTLVPVPDGSLGKVGVADHSASPESQFVVTLALAPLVDSLTVAFPSVGTPVANPGAVVGNTVDTAFVLKPQVETYTANYALYQTFVAAYNAHLSQAGVHVNDDTDNAVAAGVPTSPADFVSKMNAMRTKLANHSSNVPAGGGGLLPYHTIPDSAPPVGGVGTYTAAVQLLRSLITWYTAHIANSPAVHPVADAVNTVAATTIEYPYNLLATLPAEYKLEPGSVEISGWTIGGAPTTLYDKGDGTFILNPGKVNAGSIDYTTGTITVSCAAAPTALACVVTCNRVADRTTKTFYIDDNNNFVDALGGGGSFPSFLDVVGTNEIDRTAKTVSFKTKVSTGTLIPDGTVQATYADNITMIDVDYMELYWVLEAKGPGVYGNDIKLAFSGDSSSFVTVVYDRTSDTWKDLAGNVDTAPGATHGTYTKMVCTVRKATTAGGSVFEDKESFSGLNMTDPAAASFFPDVINDEGSGSKLFSVALPYGGGSDPSLNFVKTTENAETTGSVDWIGTGAQSKYTGRLPTAYSGGNRGLLAQTLKMTYLGADLNPVPYIVYDDGFGNLIGDVSSSGNNTIDYDTGAIDVTFAIPVKNGEAVPCIYYCGASVLESGAQLTGGSEGSGTLTTAETVSAALEPTKRGIYAFDGIMEAMTGPCIPDLYGNYIVDNLILSYAESRGNFFAPLSVPAGLDTNGTVHYRKAVLGVNSQCGALYAPLVKILDPVLNVSVNIPAMGHVAGAYVKCDASRGPGKVAAGTVDGRLLGTIGIEKKYDLDQIGVMNMAGVCVIADLPQTGGRCLWGARTLSNDEDYKFINSERVFEQVGMDLYLAMWWACFENSGINLWSRLRTQAYNYCHQKYLDKWFAADAASENQAFFIICDNSNNTPQVVKAGEVICDVYLATSVPAEFVRLRLRMITKK